MASPSDPSSSDAAERPSPAVESGESVRVRFAPSPTGLLHIGGLRTALYNYLFARRHGGTFVLRIEDTDRKRYVEEAESDILNALAWARLVPNEGPTQGGAFAPYYQSRRSERYRTCAQQLIDDGYAYYAFDSEEELEEQRRRAEDEGRAFQYDARTRTGLRNSLTMSDSEVQRLISDGATYVVRLKTPPDEQISFDDVVRGPLSYPSSDIDDQVLLKSDGLPTYHLANVVDDHHMEISHVIRGEEWLPSTPKHILLYRYFGWEPPKMAHLPLIMSPEGGKLSKRDAGDLGIPVSVRDYIEEGYEPEALVNFLAFLGWNPGDEREMFSLEELTDVFSLERVGTHGTQFDLDKLRWFNRQYLHQKAPGEIAAEVNQTAATSGLLVNGRGGNYLNDVVALVRERLEMSRDVVTEYHYFFEDPSEYDKEDVEKKWKDDSAAVLETFAAQLEDLSTYDADAVEEALRATAEEHDVGLGKVILPTRIALSGVAHGPGIYEMMALLGRDTCVRRLRIAAERLG